VEFFHGSDLAANPIKGFAGFTALLRLCYFAVVTDK